MKAIVQDKYGSPNDVLKLKDIDKPVAKDNEVLVRVYAAAVHVGDWVRVRGVPYIMRPMTGLLKPKNSVPGVDIAGTVEAVGRNVKQLQPGDEVFGWCNGALGHNSLPSTRGYSILGLWILLFYKPNSIFPLSGQK